MPIGCSVVDTGASRPIEWCVLRFCGKVLWIGLRWGVLGVVSPDCCASFRAVGNFVVSGTVHSSGIVCW